MQSSCLNKLLELDKIRFHSYIQHSCSIDPHSVSIKVWFWPCGKADFIKLSELTKRTRLIKIQCLSSFKKWWSSLKKNPFYSPVTTVHSPWLRECFGFWTYKIQMFWMLSGVSFFVLDIIIMSHFAVWPHLPVTDSLMHSRFQLAARSVCVSNTSQFQA